MDTGQPPEQKVENGQKQSKAITISSPMPRNYIARGRYLLLEKLGKGGFGLIYSGIDIQTGASVAVKLEDVSKARKEYLRLEYKIYQRYHSDWFYLPFYQQAHVPKIYDYGQDGEYRVLVMDLLGPSLSELLSFRSGKFSLKTVYQLAIKMITAIELLHAKGLLHRDIKPGNFVFGREERGNDLYLIDYGLASPYITKQGTHVRYSTNARFHGTDKYASINNHNRIEPSRRDDMESIGYLLIYFVSGSLPWTVKYSQLRNKQPRRAAYGKSKTQTSIEELTRGFPGVFLDYFRLIHKLEFQDKPNYDLLREKFFGAIEQEGAFDNVFDWSIKDTANEVTTNS